MAASQRQSWTFLAPGSPRPTGGDIARFEIANALARAGGHDVRVVHLPTGEAQLRKLSDLPWFDFDPGIDHRFTVDLDPEEIPDTDVVVYSTKLLATALAPDGVRTGRQLVEELQAGRRHRWHPILLLQGHGVFPRSVEDLARRLPGLKVCVGSWLATMLEQEGVPAEEIVHIPNGVDPAIFRVTVPIERRTPSVTMNYDPHGAKRGSAGLRAIKKLRQTRGVAGTIFGTVNLDEPLPTGLRFWRSPSRTELAEQVYNTATMFLQPSQREGFGLCAVESMACGCALVTTSNGGSDDYAFDGETAIVCDPRPQAMAEALERLAADDALRTHIALNGVRFVERFRWSTSADRLALVARQRVDRGSVADAADPLDLDEVIEGLRPRSAH